MRSKILNKAQELLILNGLNFRIDDIAESLKISKKTIYLIYKDKNELALDLFSKIYSEIQEKMKGSKNIEELLSFYKDSLFFNNDCLFNRTSINAFVKTISSFEQEKCVLVLKEKLKELYDYEIDNTLLKVINNSLISLDKNDIKVFSNILKKVIK